MQTYFVPLPEPQVRTFMETQNTINGPMVSIISMVLSDAGWIYYDQWEDGYETTLSEPVQASTQIWGDGNCSNGYPPTKNRVNAPVPCTAAWDTLKAGDVIILQNNIPYTGQTLPYYDGRDKIGATKAVAVTRALWDNAIGTVFASAVDVYDTSQYGTTFVMPAGENLPATGTPPDGFDRDGFETTRLFVMAAQDSTSCTLARGSTTLATFALSQGQGYYYNGAINSGDTLTCTKPVQADLASGDSGTTPPYYEARWYSLPSTNLWSTGYYTPVGACSTNYPALVFIRNPNSTAITVNWTNGASSGSFSVAANTTYTYEIAGTTVRGYYFYTNNPGDKFLALEAVNLPTGLNNSANYDWGFTLLSKDQASDEVLVGWGPGSRDLSVNGSPIYITPVDSGSTTIYVDFDGDPTTGAQTDTCSPTQQYDVSYTLSQYASQKLFDTINNDKDQTRTRVYTCDGKKIVATYGEDSCTAGVADPYLDLGTVIRPLPKILGSKSAELFTDNDSDGLPSPGDVLRFTIAVGNRSGVNATNLNLIDTVPSRTSYVVGSSEVSFDNGSTWTNLGSGSWPFAPPGYSFPAPPNPNGAGVLKAKATYLVRFNVTVDKPAPPDPTFLEICNTATWTSSAASVSPQVCVSLNVMDWGDLPDSYGTKLSSAGPRHSNSGLWLGSWFDSEMDGQPTTGANGDDVNKSTAPKANDEDGVTPVAFTQASSGRVGVTVRSPGCTTNCGCLNAWMDFTNNAGQCGGTTYSDGNFTLSSNPATYDSCTKGGTTYSEYIIQNKQVNAGSNTVTFSVPPGTIPGSGSNVSYYFRFRLSPLVNGACSAAIAPTGFVSGGEVEDYQFTYAPTAITLASMTATTQENAIEVAWETVSEIGNAGFNLYRDTSPDGPGIKLNNELIPSQGPDSPEGFSYSYTDAANLVDGTTYYYLLEDVSLSGNATLHEPVSVTYHAPTAVTLASFGAATSAPAALPVAGLVLATLGAAAVARRRKG